MPRNVLTALLVVGLTLPVAAATQSVSELLEKGIYTEESVGDVDRAIEIYREITSDATANRPLVAEALFRLGMCHLKSDDTAAATTAFERLIAEFPDQRGLVARARENMPDDPGSFELLPAPWVDGEVTHVSLKLASGLPIGALLLTTDSVDVEGEDAWRLRIRRSFQSSADNQSISEVLAERDSMAPLRSVFKHPLVGHFRAVYAEGGVQITTIGPDTTREEKLDGRVFDNEQGYHLFRQLPLEVGYKANLKFIAPWAGGVTPIEIEVAEREMISVPAGEFECFRVEFSVPQTMWYSTDENRYLVKVEGAGIIGELSEVYERDSTQAAVHRDDDLNVAVTAPPDWLFHELDETGTTLLLLDPNADTRSVMQVTRSHEKSAGCKAQVVATHKLEESEALLAEFTLREGTWSERDIEGRPGASFEGAYREGDFDMVYYWTHIESGDLCVEFGFKVRADRFEDLRDDFDSIIGSYEGPRPRPRPAPPIDSPTAAAVKAVITDFHHAASHADTERYFGHLAPDLVFLGTDRTERMDLDQLRATAEPYFSRGTGWVAEPIEQHVVVSDRGNMAWFDERIDSRNFGEMRASGVLRMGEDGRWRVVQYNVGFPVPNPLVGELSEKIRDLGEAVELPVGPPSVPGEPQDDPASAVKAVLRDFHLAASEADGMRYFWHIAPDAVFLGTDRSERWSVPALRAFVEPYLSRGVGWTSVPFEQRVFFSPDGEIAWFEQRIAREKVGEMRSTGVLRKINGTWKIAHCNVMIPVPNDLAVDLVERIRAFYKPE